MALALPFTVWLSTALIQVPQQRQPERGPDPAILMSLVRWNWIRTGLWSVRSVLALI